MAADAATVVGVNHGIVTTTVAIAVARIKSAAEAEVDVYVNFRLSLLNRGKGGKGSSNSGCGDEGLGNHFVSPGFKFRFVSTTTLAILDTETRPLNLNAVRT